MTYTLGPCPIKDCVYHHGVHFMDKRSGSRSGQQRVSGSAAAQTGVSDTDSSPRPVVIPPAAKPMASPSRSRVARALRASG